LIDGWTEYVVPCINYNIHSSVNYQSHLRGLRLTKTQIIQSAFVYRHVACSVTLKLWDSFRVINIRYAKDFSVRDVFVRTNHRAIATMLVCQSVCLFGTGVHCDTVLVG